MYIPCILCCFFLHLLTYLITYFLTPHSTVLLEKLTGLELVKKFPAFYGTRKFITSLTNSRHLSLTLASSIQSISPHSTSRSSLLILSSYLGLGLLSFLFPSVFPNKILCAPPYVLHAPPILFFVNYVLSKPTNAQHTHTHIYRYILTIFYIS